MLLLDHLFEDIALKTTDAYKSPVVIIALTEVFDGTVPSKILFPFP